MSESVSVILCEGFEDRAFWRGLLEHLGCTDARKYGRALDPRTKEPFEQKGVFVYRTPGNRTLIIQPAGGRDKLTAALRDHVKRLETRAVESFVVNVDSDADGALEGSEVRQFLQGLAGGAGFAPSDDLTWSRGSIPLYGIVWEVPGDPCVGVPPKQTLERLVCHALASVTPECAAGLGHWIRTSPDTCAGETPRSHHKTMMWSYFGRWFTDQGTDHFFTHLWENQGTAAVLKALFQNQGCWNRLCDIAR